MKSGREASIGPASAAPIGSKSRSATERRSWSLGICRAPRGFSTLILGQHNREGDFVYAGFCGNGLSDDTRAVILEELKATRRKTCPFRALPELRDHFRELPDTPPQWVRPSVVSRSSTASGSRTVCGTRR